MSRIRRIVDERLGIGAVCVPKGEKITILRLKAFHGLPARNVKVLGVKIGFIVQDTHRYSYPLTLMTTFITLCER
jgi:hypothetical protein